jgi:hypothetical protein
MLAFIKLQVESSNQTSESMTFGALFQKPKTEIAKNIPNGTMIGNSISPPSLGQ